MSTILDVKNLRKEFRSGKSNVSVLDNVSLSVSSGEVLFIMGPSGSGKTTLLMLIGKLLSPSSGRIEFNGKDISNINEKKRINWRLNNVGFIFQDFHLMPALSAWENVVIPSLIAGNNVKKARKKAEELLNQVGLSHRVSEYIKNLSGGEKQRVAIARSLANNPDIVLADEPTASLDHKNGTAIVKLLRDMAKNHNKIVVIVGHDERIKALADRVLYLEDGKLRDKF